MAKKSKIESPEKEGVAMKWKLKDKENDFQVTREGAFEYHTFRHGVLYSEIPPEEADKFEEVEA